MGQIYMLCSSAARRSKVWIVMVPHLLLGGAAGQRQILQQWLQRWWQQLQQQQSAGRPLLTVGALAGLAAMAAAGTVITTGQLLMQMLQMWLQTWGRMMPAHHQLAIGEVHLMLMQGD
jgi:hypothetical protein